MILKKVMTSVAAMSLAIVPVAAHAADAGKLSLTHNARVAKATKADDQLMGGGVFVAVIAAVAVILGIIIVANNDDEPNSP